MTANADIMYGDGERRHLPECPKNWSVPGDCACDLLRACEQRVADEYADIKVSQRYHSGNNSSDMRIKVHTLTLAEYEDVKRRAYAAGLGAARAAVRNCEDGEYFPWVQVEIALAAIDTLSGEQ